jgi:hypothetical protein
MKQIDVREGARRQHRTMALFSMIQCWMRGLDGIAYYRSHLERLLGLERFKQTRIDWLQKDIKELFPHQELFWSSDKESFSSLFVSRKKLKQYLPKGSMTTQKRIEGIAENGPIIGVFQIWKRPNKKKAQESFSASIPFFSDYANYDERLLSSYLNLLINGQISVDAIPQLIEEKE